MIETRGIEFNGKHTYHDFGLDVVDFHIGYPSKIKRVERIPFSNELYDFSNLYQGANEYEERELTYTFQAHSDAPGDIFNSYTHYDSVKTTVFNWLMDTQGKVILKDDLIPGYYFLAEVVSNIEDTFNIIGGQFTVEFTAYPFRIGESLEGNDLWDPFNFETDVAQVTNFNINGSQEVVLYNVGASVVQPTIKASAPMTIKKDGATFNIPAGQSQSPDFALLKGESKFIIEGNGTISFEFRKELL